QSAWFSPDRKWLLTRILKSSSESDGQLALFDATRGTRRFSFAWKENRGAGFSSSGEVFWVATPAQLPEKGSKISFYEVRSGQKLWDCLQRSDAPPLFSPRDEVFMVGAAGLERRLVRGGRLVQNISGPVSSLCHLALSPDASQIWSSHDDGQIWSWRVR
ncbi:MAG TPA: WD40 repeat domain-containing protein, partial [Abditibacterium sp.]